MTPALARRARWRANAGFTLLELVFVLLVGALAFALAADLLRSVQLVFLDAAREVLDPQPRLTATLLRRDVRAALAVPPVPGLTSAAALDLPQPGGTVVRYERVDDRLVRRELAADGSELGELVVLRPCVSWGWREEAPGLLDITFATIEHRTDRSLLASGPERLAPAVRPHVVRLQVGPRAGRAGY